MRQRYYAVVPEVYEQTRLALDSAWEHGPAGKAMTCVTPAAAAPRSSDGRVVLAVWDSFVAYPAVAALLPSLLASGAVHEITRAEYDDALPKWAP